MDSWEIQIWHLQQMRRQGGGSFHFDVELIKVGRHLEKKDFITGKYIIGLNVMDSFNLTWHQESEEKFFSALVFSEFLRLKLSHARASNTSKSDLLTSITFQTLSPRSTLGSVSSTTQWPSTRNL